jgi:hypothetical protein
MAAVMCVMGEIYGLSGEASEGWWCMCSKSEAQETRGPQAEPIGSALTCL